MTAPPPARPARLPPRRRHAFTLVELVATLAVLAVVSLTAIPALARLESVRGAALAGEIDRRLSLARARAVATGLPHGLRLDVFAQTMTPLLLEESGVERAPGSTGDTDAGSADAVASLFDGATILSVSIPASADATIWFDAAGLPELREPDGDPIGPLTRDALVGVSGGKSVRVHAFTGMVEHE